MSARFRIRTSQGQEISFASHEMFAEFVRSGELSPDDVVYDAETKEWSSALTHPLVLQIEVETEEGADGTEAGRAAADPEQGADGDEEGVDEAAEQVLAQPRSAGDDIGLELAPRPEELSPEEQSAAFVKKMEAERASSLDYEDDPGIQGFRMEQGSSGLVEGIVERPEEAPPEPPKERPKPPPRREPSPESAREKPRKEEKKRKKRKKKKKGRSLADRHAPLVILGVVVVSAGVYFGPDLLAPTAEEGTEAGEDSVNLPPPPEPLIPDTEEALRGRAQERYLTTTRALLRDLPPIPDAWLSGSYLATPTDYPEVRQVWNEYLTSIRQVRAGDNERYRAGYSRALDEAQVEGASRTLRLAGAVAAFQSGVEARAAHYDRVEALAMAALRGHDALVEAEGTIAYEPAATTPVSGDPVIEAVGRNPDAQAFLEQVLDMILAELEEPDGPGRSANVGEWIWGGILDVVTS